MTAKVLESLIIKDNNSLTGQSFHFLNKDIKELDVTNCAKVT